MKKPLSASPARTNLTDREIAKIIGGLLGGLLDMTDIYSLRHAVQWLADTPEFWHELEKKPFDRERFRRGVAEALEEMKTVYSTDKLTEEQWDRVFTARCKIRNGELLSKEEHRLRDAAIRTDRDRFDSMDQDVLSATAIIRSPLRK